MLKRIDKAGFSGGTVWCGPGAVAILTGVPLIQVAEVMCRVSDTPYAQLEGTTDETVVLTLRELGYRAEVSEAFAQRYRTSTYGPLLHRFLADQPVMERAAPHLIELNGNHWATTHMGFLADNWTDGAPRQLDAYPHPRRHVTAIWKVTPL